MYCVLCCAAVFCGSCIPPPCPQWFRRQETHIQLTHIQLPALLSSSVSGITSTNIIIGAIVGSILFLALILAVTAWCYK